MIALQILAGWLLADFLSGIFHWFEDRYLDETQTLDFFHGVASDNQQHHAKPTAMLLCTKWENMRSSALFAWPLAALAAWFSAPLWLVTALVSVAFANLVHRFSHTPQSQLPTWIRAMQRTGLFITHRHHDLHHRSRGRLIPKASASVAYCPMTNWVNPILDLIGFWSFLEAALRAIRIRTIDERQ